MRAASLPAGALEDRGDGAFETLVAIADHQLHASQTTRHQSAQEAQPEGAVLTGSDIHPEHFALAGRRIEPDRDDDRHVHHAVILPHFQEGGVDPNVRIDPIEFAGAEALHLGIQLFAQAADLALADAIQTQGFDQVVDTARAHALHVGLAHGRHQGSLRSLAGLQQARKEAAITDAGDPQLERAHPRIPGPISVAVALPLSIRAALVIG